MGNVLKLVINVKPGIKKRLFVTLVMVDIRSQTMEFVNDTNLTLLKKYLIYKLYLPFF